MNKRRRFKAKARRRNRTEAVRQYAGAFVPDTYRAPYVIVTVTDAERCARDGYDYPSALPKDQRWTAWRHTALGF